MAPPTNRSIRPAQLKRAVSFYEEKAIRIPTESGRAAIRLSRGQSGRPWKARRRRASARSTARRGVRRPARSQVASRPEASTPGGAASPASPGGPSSGRTLRARGLKVRGRLGRTGEGGDAPPPRAGREATPADSCPTSESVYRCLLQI